MLTQRAQSHVQVANLKIALETALQIGAAVGVLMANLSLPLHEAFDLLREASNRWQQKLRDIAIEVLVSGRLELAAPI